MSKLLINIPLNNKQASIEFIAKSKFYGDTFKHENSEFMLIMLGINLSFNSLDTLSNFNYIIQLYNTEGEQFFSGFRGSFGGVLWDKKTKKWLIFNNHIGDQKLFYSISNERVLISTDLFNITEELSQNNEAYSLNQNAAYSLLSYGYMINDHTLVDKVNRITAGEFLRIDENVAEKLNYYKLNNTPSSKHSEEEHIERIDSTFRKAIQLEYDKDIQYGMDHLASMSGGLDCRMNNWVARDMGYKSISNLTFSQYGYLDMTLAHAMSSHLKNDWIFKSLDHGNYLMEIDNQVRNTNALVSFAGSAHARTAMQDINFSRFGILHSGQVGDVIISSFLPPKTTYSKASPDKLKAISTRLASKINPKSYPDYENNELANLYIRAFNGALTGNFTSQAFTEVASPFLDVDFMDLCLSIPIEQRASHNLYKKWILKKYPDAAQFKWESINAKINDKTIHFRGKDIAIKQLPNFISEGIKHHLGQNIKMNSKNGMNPFDYWLKTNTDLNTYCHKYYEEHVELVSNGELKKDLIHLFNSGNASEKMLVLTLLSAIKQLGL